METDHILLRRYAANRDPDAFAELARRHRGLVFATARRVTGSHHDAEDVAQACFMELAGQADGLQGPLPGWLHARATSRAIDAVRARASRQRREGGAVPFDDLPAEVPPADPDWHDVAPIVDEAFEELPEDLRLPLILHYLQDRNQKQIAAELRVSRTTVQRRLAQGIDELRKRISRNTLIASSAVLAGLLKQNAAVATPAYLNASLMKFALAGVGRGGYATSYVPATVPWLTRVFACIAGLGFAKTSAVGGAALVLMIVSAFGWNAYGPGGHSAVYDAIADANRPFLTADDPLGLPAKMRSVAADRLRYWHGTKDLFFAWCRDHAADWAADPSSHVDSVGDLHLGNVGTYAAGDGAFGSLGFGLVDFDQAARLPFQVELLQAAISLRLTARQHDVALADADHLRVVDALATAYRDALIEPGGALAAATSTPAVSSLLSRGRARSYGEELGQYVGAGGRFYTVVRGGDGGVKDVLRPAADLTRAQAGAAIAQAVAASPRLRAAFRAHDRAAIVAMVKHVVRRTRLGAADQQGQDKYLVLLDRPLVGVGHDLIVYLKQQIAPAAERSGYVAPVPGGSPAGQLVARMTGVSERNRYLHAAVDVDGRSFLLSVKEPWSNELDPAAVRSVDALLRSARVVGAVGGASHGNDPRARALAARVTPSLVATIDARAAAYAARLEADYAALRADRRTTADARATDAAVEAARRASGTNPLVTDTAHP